LIDRFFEDFFERKGKGKGRGRKAKPRES